MDDDAPLRYFLPPRDEHSRRRGPGFSHALSFRLAAMFVAVTIVAAYLALWNAVGWDIEFPFLMSILCSFVAALTYAILGPWKGWRWRSAKRARRPLHAKA